MTCTFCRGVCACRSVRREVLVVRVAARNRHRRPVAAGRLSPRTTAEDQLDRSRVIAALCRLVAGRRRGGLLVTPSTILRWTVRTLGLSGFPFSNQQINDFNHL